MIKKYGYAISAFGVITAVIVLAAGVGSRGETPPSAFLSEPQDFCRITVQKDDTLSQIALRLTGKTGYYTELMHHNNLTSEAIYPGDIVQIPRQLLLPHYQCPLDAYQSSSDVIKKSAATPRNANTKVLAEIEVLVFEDRNGNGEDDAEEPGMPGIQVILVRGGSVRTSDKEGRVLFTEVEAGEHAVGVEEATFPEEYRLCTQSSVLISLAEGDKGYVAFGMCAVPPSTGISD